MTDHKKRAYTTLLRMARVKEVRADVALAWASVAEAEQRHRVDRVLDARNAVAIASQACIGDGVRLDLGRYEMLALLDMALADKHAAESQRLDEASRMRKERASENVQAKRYRERVGEKLVDVGSALMHTRLAKTQEEMVELWIDHKEGAP